MNNAKPNKTKKYVSIFFSVLILILITCNLKKKNEVLLSLKNLRISDILIIILLQPITVTSNVLINNLITKEMGFMISYIDRYKNFNDLESFAVSLPVIESRSLGLISGRLERKIHQSSSQFPGWEQWTIDLKRKFEEICGPQMEELGYPA